MDKYYLSYERRDPSLHTRVPASLHLALGVEYDTEDEAKAVAKALSLIWKSYKFRILKQVGLF